MNVSDCNESVDYHTHTAQRIINRTWVTRKLDPGVLVVLEQSLVRNDRRLDAVLYRKHIHKA